MARCIGRLAGLGMILGMATLGGCVDTMGPLAVVVGRDCSIVRFSDGKSYCKPIESSPPAFCTKSLAAVDCWDRPSPFGYYQRGLVDGPTDLTTEQEWRRITPWPSR